MIICNQFNHVSKNGFKYKVYNTTTHDGVNNKQEVEFWCQQILNIQKLHKIKGSHVVSDYITFYRFT